MPSTVVHVALAGLVGTALLAEHFDGKAVAVVMAAVALVDFDVFLGFWIEGAHRAAFHTLLLPALGGALLWADLRGRALPSVQSRVGSGAGSRSLALVTDRSLVRSRWGARGVRVAWVTVVAVAFAGIGLDAFFNGANLLYPVHDRFYTFSGKVFYSTKEGFVQTLVHVDLQSLVDAVLPNDASAGGADAGGGAGTGAESGGAESGGGGNSKPVRTTENTHYSTGIDPKKGAEQGSVERLFPIAYSGERALLALTGYTVVGLRVWMERRRA
ncbi:MULTISPECIES: metal-dependent hydrolase [Halorussus]|uniref:metal-dependent hydrolase n=1 Tax=Halorussus TaxID=1070314 RepID=UPI000E20DF2A|nr:MULTISPECIES: metal-dependent hydrolase [Halorussus]NHN59547.1 metal-dependent hydrolase [Halorussus sp. JP-T4]